MNKNLMFFLILIITANFFIFGFGVYSEIASSSYSMKIKERLLLDSCLVLASHSYEDKDFSDFKGKVLDKSAGYIIRPVENDNIQITVFTDTSRESYQIRK